MSARYEQVEMQQARGSSSEQTNEPKPDINEQDGKPPYKV